MPRSFDPASPGARRLVDTARRMRLDHAPATVTLLEPLVDLDLGASFPAGATVTIDAGKARDLIARGTARRP